MAFESWSERRSAGAQGALFVTYEALPQVAGHPFYEELNRLLDHIGFDKQVETQCEPFYKDASKGGRPGIPPGVYFRLHLIGFFEGIDSERGVCWRVADSLSLRSFLGYALTDKTPDHSSLSRIRTRLDLATHRRVFALVLSTLVEAGIVKGRDVGIDATTLEANAAMRSIVRREDGRSYDGYLDDLCRSEDGIDEPTREDRVKKDRKRPKKGSNKEWKHPGDEDAKIAKMKDGSTHLAHKAEHVIDLEGQGAMVGVSLHGADRGDTATGLESLDEAFGLLSMAIEDVAGEALSDDLFRSVTEDAGYHSDDVLEALEDKGVTAYVCEPPNRREKDRSWKGKADGRDRRRRLYAARRRNQTQRGRQLQRKRSELNERSNAHLYETGGMRRVHLRGRENILKRLSVHGAGFNLSILMRNLTGVGKPRVMQGARGSGQDAGRACGGVGAAVWAALHIVKIVCRRGWAWNRVIQRSPRHAWPVEA